MADWEVVLKQLLTYYPDLEYKIGENSIALPSICHNLDIHHPDKNLHLYKNNGLFHCFSQCQCTMNLNQLLRKREKLEGRQLLRQFDNFSRPRSADLYTDTLRRIQTFNALQKQDKTWSRNFLNTYAAADTLNPWFVEGIDLEILQDFKVGFSKPDNAVIIPHFNVFGQLVGIRRRSYTDLNNKYMPWSWGGTLLTHPLSNNLYGINKNLQSIQHKKVLYLAEAEKSVLQARMFGLDCVLATCGSSFSQAQTTLIQKYLKPNVVIVAYDKEYTNAAGQAKYFVSLREKFKGLTHYCDVYALMDSNDIFGYKQSPFDKTIEDFKALEEWRI